MIEKEDLLTAYKLVVATSPLSLAQLLATLSAFHKRLKFIFVLSFLLYRHNLLCFSQTAEIHFLLQAFHFTVVCNANIFSVLI